MLFYREKFMKNAKTQKMKPFGLLKFKRFHGNESSLPTTEPPTAPNEAPSVSPSPLTFEEEENAFLSFCKEHETRARRLRKR